MSLSFITYKIYNDNIGVMPSTEDFNRTMAVVDCLLENGFNAKEIYKIAKELFKNYDNDNNIDLTYESVSYKRKQYITFNELPEELWENSLTEKDKFYYSEILHLKSKAPSWNPITFQEECEEFYLEMKIRFTIDDLLEYYYSKCRIEVEFRDDKKAKGALLYLIEKYNKLNIATGLDIVIGLINEASNDIDNIMITDVFKIDEYLPIVIESLKAKTNEAELLKANKIVWRKK